MCSRSRIRGRPWRSLTDEKFGSDWDRGVFDGQDSEELGDDDDDDDDNDRK